MAIDKAVVRLATHHGSAPPSQRKTPNDSAGMQEAQLAKAFASALKQCGLAKGAAGGGGSGPANNQRRRQPRWTREEWREWNEKNRGDGWFTRDQKGRSKPIAWTCENCGEPHDNPQCLKCRSCGSARPPPVAETEDDAEWPLLEKPANKKPLVRPFVDSLITEWATPAPVAPESPPQPPAGAVRAEPQAPPAAARPAAPARPQAPAQPAPAPQAPEVKTRPAGEEAAAKTDPEKVKNARKFWEDMKRQAQQGDTSDPGVKDMIAKAEQQLAALPRAGKQLTPTQSAQHFEREYNRLTKMSEKAEEEIKDLELKLEEAKQEKVRIVEKAAQAKSALDNALRTAAAAAPRRAEEQVRQSQEELEKLLRESVPDADKVKQTGQALEAYVAAKVQQALEQAASAAQRQAQGPAPTGAPPDAPQHAPMEVESHPVPMLPALPPPGGQPLLQLQNQQQQLQQQQQPTGQGTVAAGAAGSAGAAHQVAPETLSPEQREEERMREEKIAQENLSVLDGGRGRSPRGTAAATDTPPAVPASQPAPGQSGQEVIP